MLPANRYRVVRRAKNQVILFGKLDIWARFGTEGSVACPAVALAEADSNPLAPTIFSKVSPVQRMCNRRNLRAPLEGAFFVSAPYVDDHRKKGSPDLGRVS
jgi:hypothetical protein